MGWVFFRQHIYKKIVTMKAGLSVFPLSSPEAVIYFRNGDHTYEFSSSHIKRTQIASEVIGIQLSFGQNLQC